MARDVALSIEINDKRWTQFHEDLFNRNLAFATSVAINRTMYQTQQTLRTAMEKTYKGGAVPFTKSSVLYGKSDKRNLYGMVFVNPNGDRDYIMDTMTGGEVKPARGKRTRIQPVRMRLTKQGNISNRYDSGSGGKVAQMLAKKKFFSGHPKGRAKTDDNAGVWERMGRKGRMSIRMVAHYKKSWKQKAVFPGFDIAEKKIQRVFGNEFVIAIKRATNGRIY